MALSRAKVEYLSPVEHLFGQGSETDRDHGHATHVKHATQYKDVREGGSQEEVEEELLWSRRRLSYNFLAQPGNDKFISLLRGVSPADNPTAGYWLMLLTISWMQGFS